MTQDLLDEATQSLAEFGQQPAPEASATRARVLSELRGRRRRRVERRLVFIPAAAILLLGTAAAAATGSLSRAWEWVESAVVPAEPAEVGATAPVGTPTPWGPAAAAAPVAPDDAEEETAPAEEDTDEPPSSEEAALPTAPAPAAGAASPAAYPRKVAPAPAVASGARAAAPPRVASTTLAPPQGAPAAPAGVDPSEALYRKAHQAHFAARNFPRALSAWDEYLKAAPRGRFALEARYNRAICMLRLGDATGARTALRPFADGKFGEYRRDEATRLLRALEAKTPRPTE